MEYASSHTAAFTGRRRSETPRLIHPADPAPTSRIETRDGAFELKFLLRDDQVEGVIGWAFENLAADPHANRTPDATYRIHSVYLDTDDYAVYRRRPGFRASKFRLRRYGTEEWVYLEEKRKRGGWVTKQRTAVPDADLRWLEAAEVPQEWAGAWFHQAVAERQLVPSCQVVYRRLAREGVAEGAPVRMTLDREIRCTIAEGLRPSLQTEIGTPIHATVLELKFRDGLPRLFKELVRTFGLIQAPSSKYRRAAEACGFALEG